jgi:hypothetical protein
MEAQRQNSPEVQEGTDAVQHPEPAVERLHLWRDAGLVVCLALGLFKLVALEHRPAEGSDGCQHKITTSPRSILAIAVGMIMPGLYITLFCSQTWDIQTHLEVMGPTTNRFTACASPTNASA